MSSTRHQPVLLNEVLAYLAVKPGGVYLDGTVGGGGHARAILAASRPDGRLIGFDRDPAALVTAAVSLEDEASRFRLVRASYAEAEIVFAHEKQLFFDGILLDLGLSSDQLADLGRGFSFQGDQPLDLRFDPTTGQSTADLLVRLREPQLVRILAQYGELSDSRRIARRLVAIRPIETTSQLRHASGLRQPRSLARLFQALRIATNDELAVLEQGLEGLWPLLKPGGRFVVISFHSLEDRLVKRYFRSRADQHQAVILTKKPVVARPEEQRLNPRSRSAKLRAIEKIDSLTYRNN